MVRTLWEIYNSFGCDKDGERCCKLWLETLTDDERESIWIEQRDRELYPEMFEYKVME